MLIRAVAVSVSVSEPRVEDTRPSPLTSPDTTSSRPINTSTLRKEGAEGNKAGQNCNFHQLLHGGSEVTFSTFQKLSRV